MIRSTLVAVITAVAIISGCAHQPDPPEAQRTAEVQKLPFHTDGMVQFKIVDADSPYMHKLVEHVPDGASDPQVRVEHDRWSADRAKPAGEDIFLTAPTRADLERFVGSVPSITLPSDREVAFGRVDSADRWRTYIVHSTASLDGSDIASAELTRDAAHDRISAMVGFTPHGAEQFASVTEKIIGQKLAVLVDGSVIAAPVIMSKISGGRAEITVAR
ncbi:MAG TPA: hypothetical protein VGM39_21105 [Kofleriaceae bacterium]|jgi:hypothetical protein